MPTPGTQHHRIHTGYFGDNVHFLSYFQLSYYYLDNKVDKIILLAVKSEGRSNEATLLLTLLLL